MVDTSNNQASFSTLLSLPSPPVIRSWGCSPPWSRQQAPWWNLTSGHGSPTTLSTLVQCCSTGRRVWPYHHDLIDMWMITCTDVFVQLSQNELYHQKLCTPTLMTHYVTSQCNCSTYTTTNYSNYWLPRQKTQHIQNLQSKLWTWPLLLATWTKLWSICQCLTWGTQKL